MSRRFWYEAGALTRGSIKAGLKQGAIRFGVTLDIDEDKGFLASTYYVTVHGDPRAVDRYITAVNEWFALAQQEEQVKQ